MFFKMATDAIECNICSEKITENQVFVECNFGCKCLFHYGCVGLSKSVANSIANCSQLYYRCEKCSLGPCDSIKRLENKQDEVLLIVKELQRELSKCVDTINNQSKEIAELKMHPGITRDNLSVKIDEVKSVNFASVENDRLLYSDNNATVKKQKMVRFDYAPSSASECNKTVDLVPEKLKYLSVASSVKSTPLSAELPNTSYETGKNVDDGFTKVTSKRKPRVKPIIGISTDNSIAGVPRLIHLHVWRFKEDTTTEAVRRYISGKIPGKYFEIEQLKVTKGAYSSFHVSVGEDLKGTLEDPGFWPEHVCVNRYFFLKGHLTLPKG
jgi:hypothetical protein